MMDIELNELLNEILYRTEKGERRFIISMTRLLNLVRGLRESNAERAELQERLRSAESECINAKNYMVELSKSLTDACVERDQLRQRIEAAEKQAPVGYVVIGKGISFYNTNKDEAQYKANALEWRDDEHPTINPVYLNPFYALPPQQAAIPEGAYIDGFRDGFKAGTEDDQGLLAHVIAHDHRPVGPSLPVEQSKPADSAQDESPYQWLVGRLKAKGMQIESEAVSVLIGLWRAAMNSYNFETNRRSEYESQSVEISGGGDKPVYWVCEHSNHPWPLGGGRRFETQAMAENFLSSELNFCHYDTVSPIYRKPSPNKADVLDEIPVHVLDSLSEVLGDAVDCSRTWSAWRYGTMRESDFHPVAHSSERVEEIARAVLESYFETTAPQDSHHE